METADDTFSSQPKMQRISSLVPHESILRRLNPGSRLFVPLIPASKNFHSSVKSCQTLKETLQVELKNSLKAKDKLKTVTIKGLMAEFLDAEKAMPAQQPKSEGDYIAILRKSIQRRQESAALYKGTRPDLAEKEVQEAGILSAYLPKSISPEELEAKVREIITANKIENAKGLGQVMKHAQDLIDAGVAKKDISEVAKQILGKL